MRTHHAARARTRDRKARSWVAVAAALLAPAAAAQPELWRSGDDLGRGRLFSLPRSQDDIFEWRQAGLELREGQSALAVERLHRLLQNAHPGVVPVDESGESFLGLRAAVVATLRDLPEEARAKYEKLTQREAGRLLRTAFEGARPEQLAILAETFPCSSAGQAARLRLGDLALEAGRGIEAEFHYRAALDVLPATSPERPAVTRRLWAAQILAGGTTCSTPEDADRRVIARELEVVIPGGLGRDAGGWPAYGGGGTSGGVMAPPLGNPTQQGEVDVRARGFRDRLYPMHAVGDLTGIILNDGVTIHCYDPLSGQLLWEAPGPLADDAHDLEDYSRSINRDMALAAACSPDVAVAALQVPTRGQNTTFRHIDVIRHIPRRRLFAVDRASGKRLWGHWDRFEGAVTRRFEGHDAAGPPLIYGDTVYVASHDQTGAVAYYLSAYDLHTGEPRWRQLICSSQGEVNMFGNSRREYAASPLATADGLVFGSTNLGVCFAAEAATGRIRWVTAYEVIPLPETRLTDQQDRQVLFANNPTVVADGVMACTPLDSAYALGLDIATGELLWRLYHRSSVPRPDDIRWLLGAQGDEFVFAGLGVIAVKARPGGRPGQPSVRVVRSADSLELTSDLLVTSQSVPRGALTEDRIYYASPAGLQVFSRRGDQPSAAGTASRARGLGNLLLVDGILVSVRDGSLAFYYDRQQLLRAAEERVQENGDDPAALLRLASLVRGGSGEPVSAAAAERAEKLYRRALEAAGRAGMGPTSPSYRRIAGELFRLTVERANRLRATQPKTALELMRAARDGALGAEEWLQAQRAVLQWVEGDARQYLAELDLMAQRHGSVVHRFPGQDPMPVAAYVLWQTAQRSDSAPEAVRRCQDLIERFPEIVVDGRMARDFALDRQLELISERGREVYADIESRAQTALESADGDPALLAAMVQRYPHSLAAARARTVIMDRAVERGDLGAAARSYAQALAEGSASPSVTRRMMEAARIAGNAPLARELARRLLSESGSAISDYGPDRGRAMAEVVSLPPLPAPVEAPRLQRPFDVLAEKKAGSSAIPLRLCESRVAAEFGRPARIPLLVFDGRSLEAYDLAAADRIFERPLFSVPFHYQEGEDLLICGETLILPELDQVRGVDLRSGEEKWAVRGGPERMLVSLGCQAGILHLFSEHRKAGDGGILLGVEPLSGAILLRRPFPRDSESMPPASSGGRLWVFRPGGEEARAEILGLDPLTGLPEHRLVLGTPLLRRLGLEDPDTRAWRAHLLHKTMFADADTVYLPVDGDERAAPRIAAIDFRGEERWLWHGMRGREIPMAALHGDRVVIVERGSRASRLILLDRVGGALVREQPLGPTALVSNWSRTERSSPAPDALMLVDHGANLGLNLTCFSLDGRITSFAHGLHGQHQHVVREPLLGEDFVAIAARRRDDAFTLFVLDLKTRRSVLPDGASGLRLPLRPPFKLQAANPYTAVQHAEGITVLGERGGPPK